MDLQQTIHERDITITELNIELREKVGRMEQHISHQRALSEQRASLRISGQHGGEAPYQMSQEPDATILLVTSKYFWGKHIISYDIKKEEWSKPLTCPNSIAYNQLLCDMTIIGGKQPNLDPANSHLSFISSEWVKKFSPMPTKCYWTTATSYNRVIAVKPQLL